METGPIHVLMLDNYDSFTWNLYQYLSLLGANVTVVRSQSCTLEELIDKHPSVTHLVISPGPGHPTTDAGISIPAILHYSGKLPILGICMGLQCIYTAFGGVVDGVGTIVHGKTSRVFHDRRGIFESLTQGIQSTRYHSLAGNLGTLPDVLEVSAWSNPTTADDPKLNPSTSIIMAIRHKKYTIEAVQYHPESILSEEGKNLLKNFLSLRSGMWSENVRSSVSKSPLPASSSISPASVPSESLPTILQSICHQRSLDIIEAKKTPGSSPEDLKQKIKLHIAPVQIDFYRRLQQTRISSEVSPLDNNCTHQIALMAEIKRASPSKGSFVTSSTPTPPEIGLSYALAGASTISVLTEPTWFKGTLMDMLSVRLALENTPNRPAILRKDFILDHYQIDEARCYGADTILLIVACLSDEKLESLFKYSKSLGMEPLVEVNNEEELGRALRIGSRVIGVNNRNLHDFKVDMNTTSRIVQAVRQHDPNFPSPSQDGIIICALSGISSRADVERYVQEGVGAVLVGESLMKAEDKRGFVQELLGTTPTPPSSTTAKLTPLVKICGIKTPEVALFSARAGADLIGLIFVPKSRRYVTPAQANSIVRLVRASQDLMIPSIPGATPSSGSVPPTEPNEWFSLQTSRFESSSSTRKPFFVGVFQDSSLSEILNVIEQVPLDFIQLHGQESIQLSRFLPIPVIKTFHVNLDGPVDRTSFQDLFRTGYHSLPLLDSQTSSQTGGTGKTFDWNLLDEVPEVRDRGSKPLILAGGLNHENVKEAIRSVRPLIVDVSGGVEDPETGEKDPIKVLEFIKAVKNAL